MYWENGDVHNNDGGKQYTTTTSINIKMPKAAIYYICVKAFSKGGLGPNSAISTISTMAGKFV